MENDIDYVVICLSGYECIVCFFFPFDTRMATVAENIVAYINSCAFDGGSGSKASQAIC